MPRKKESKDSKKEIEDLKKESKVLEGISLIVALGTLIGIIYNGYLSFNNQKLTEKIAEKQDQIGKVQTVVDYIPYLSIDRKEQRKIAVVALSKILDPETAILMGIAAGGDIEIDEAVEAIGESAIQPLVNIANDTKDQKLLSFTRSALKKFDRETVIVKISSIKYDLSDSNTFPSGKIFVNLRVSKLIDKIWIDWGNGKDTKGSLYEIPDIQSFHRPEENWHSYSFSHQYTTIGQKNIKIKMIFEKEGKEYFRSKKIKIERIE